MPKIRQAIAVLAAAAFCIGFNTYRYPVVREMVSAASFPAQSEASSSTEKAAAEGTRDGDGAARTATSKRRAGTVCKDGVCTLPLADSPSASLKGPSETETGHDDLGGVGGPADTLRESVPSYGQSLDSGPTDDEASSPFSQSAEESATPAGSDPDAESTWNSREAGRSKTALSDEAKSNAMDETTHPESHDPAAESYPDDAAAKRDRYSTSTYGAAGKSPGRKTAAKLMSASGGRDAPSADSDELPSTTASLIPIVRPAPQAKRTKNAAAKATSDFRLPAEQRTKSQGVRHLPPVASDSGAGTPALPPDLMRTYPVTSAKQ